MAGSRKSGGYSRLHVREFAIAALVGILGYLTTQLSALTVGSMIVALLPGQGETVAYPGLIVGFGVGAIVFATLYFAGSRHDWSYVDITVPSRRDLAYVAGSLGLLLVALLAISQVLELLDVAPSAHGIEQDAREGDPTVLLYLIPLTILVIAPGEELLFRNIIQKRLDETFSTRAAILAASVIFALVHFGAYATSESVAEVGGSLGVVFLLSVVLGWSYAKTENLLVPTLAHGVYNALQFGVLYITIT